MRKLTKEQRRDVAAIAAKKDADIDFSDIPAVLDWSEAGIGKFYPASEETSDHSFGCRCFGMAKIRGAGVSNEG